MYFFEFSGEKKGDLGDYPGVYQLGLREDLYL